MGATGAAHSCYEKFNLDADLVRSCSLNLSEPGGTRAPFATKIMGVRMAVPLLGAHGGGTVVHYGLLRACNLCMEQPNCRLTLSHRRSLPPRLHAQIIMFSDLECDYINPIDLCNKLNQVRIPLSRQSQPPQDDDLLLVCPARKQRPRIPMPALPHLGAMDSASA